MIGLRRAWSLIALTSNERQYGGNTGYDDELKSTYRYDSHVANHKQLAPGHLVFIRDSKHLVGLAQIDSITPSIIQKVRQRCPECGQVSIKFRKTKPQPWRCSEGHEFNVPRSETVSLTGYAAAYGRSFIATPDAIQIADIKAAALRPNDQLSIEELDLGKIEGIVTSKFPETRALIARFLDGAQLAPTDANVEGTGAGPGSSFIPSMSDTRELILRSIKLRRGQRTFRDKLLKRYGGRCVVSGCDLTDVLEAAHIDPYRGANDNHPENGLLLRADLHTLFDLNLMAIDPNGLTVKFHPRALVAGYALLDGKALRLTSPPSLAVQPLLRRWSEFQKGLHT